MAKFSGVIGYAAQQKTKPGVWEDCIIERPYRGDILQNMNRWKTSEQVNDNLTIDNKISIISDPYACENFGCIRYIKWMGVRWKVNTIEIVRPRLILSIGGVYNGPTPDA